MRRRTDDNQAEIVSELRKLGASVCITSSLGHGFPDLTVGFRGVTYLIEIKDGAKPPSRWKLTKDEEAFRASWRGHYAVVKSVAEAFDVVSNDRRMP